MTEDETREVLVRLTRIETLIEGFLNKSSDHEDRLRTLEKRSYISPKLYWLGTSVAAGLGASAGAVLQAVSR